MKRNIALWMRLVAILITYHFSLLPSFAQSDDFGIDLSLEAQKKIDNHWSVGVEAEYRNRNKMKTNDRWSAGVDVSYKFTKWLKASAGYAYLYDNNERTSYCERTDDNVLDGDVKAGDPKKCAQYWGSRHRFNLSLSLDEKIFGNFRFSLRERWQYTYRPEHTVAQRWSYYKQAWVDEKPPKIYKGKGKSVLRSRLQVEYDKKRALLTPYASIEFFNAWSVEKVRYIVGTDFKLNRQHSVGLFYRYQSVHNQDDFDLEPNTHMVGFGYKYKF